MATLPVLLNPSPTRPSRPVNTAWIGAFLGFLFVASTSNNYMGGTHSQAVLTKVWEGLLGNWHVNDIGPANLYLRKVGHFIGHGLLSLVFCRAWYSTVRQKASLKRVWRRPAAGTLAVLTTFTIACLDEWHQSYVPGRVGSVRDVMIDASGALVANLIFLAIMMRRTPRLVRTEPRNIPENVVSMSLAA